MKITESQPTFYQDTSKLRQLRGREGLEAAASEFEALFLQMVLKNMRSATDAIADEDSFLSSQQTRFYQEMADGQTAAEMARRGTLGIAEALVRQWGDTVAGEEPLKISDHPVAVTDQDTVVPAQTTTTAFQQPLNRPVNRTAED